MKNLNKITNEQEVKRTEMNRKNEQVVEQTEMNRTDE